MKYIAYGSNMVKEQMAYRCPGAKLIGTGYLPNHRLAFYLPRHRGAKPRPGRPRAGGRLGNRRGG